MYVINTEKIPIKIWASTVEDDALEQAKNLANLPFAFKHVALMPDTHQGFGMPIGGVLATKGVVVPNAVGVDIGCGMLAIKTDYKVNAFDTEYLESVRSTILNNIPVGFNHHEEQQEWHGFDFAPDLPVIQRELEKSKYQLGTLGGGNHFIELQNGSDGHIWLMIHSGSRNFGYQIAKEYHEIAKDLCCNLWYSNIPTPDLAFLPIEHKLGSDYIEAMNFACAFALANREYMSNKIMEGIHAKELLRINIHHNYANFEEHYGETVVVHRKGATSARSRQLGIIPGSMGSKSYIVRGRGNKESFNSCSHGAGRVMGRKQAKKSLNLAEEQKIMSNVVHGLNSESKLDEAPSAYKNISEVMENQKDLVIRMIELTPIMNVKG